MTSEQDRAAKDLGTPVEDTGYVEKGKVTQGRQEIHSTQEKV